MPSFDVTAYCYRLAQAHGEDNFVRDECLAQEQECIGKLLSTWPQIPAPMQSMCPDMAQS